MSVHRPSILSVASCVLVSFAGLQSVAAQPASVQAEQLFRQGKKLMGEGKIAEACKAFEGSYRKDEVVSTLLNLADCREKNKQYASAWGYFLDAERKTRGDTSQATFNTTAKNRAAALEAKLSYLIVNVPAESNIDGLTITRNGVPIDSAEWNTDIPVDGGEYVIEGKAPGYEAWSTKVSVSESGDKESVNVPKFRQRPDAMPDAKPDGHTVNEPIDDKVSVPASSSRKKIGQIAVASGGALVLGGLAVGYMAQQKWSDAKDACGPDLACGPDDDFAAGQASVDAARTRGNISTIVTGTGIVALGVGTALWLTAPSAEASGRRTSGLAILATGGAALTSGLLLGYSARERWGDAEALCGTDHVCDGADNFARGQELVDSARFRGNVSTVLTGVGVAGVGLGAVLWLTSSPKRTEAAASALRVVPSITPDSVSVSLGGSL
jgi:hypothetical protein